MQELHTSSEEAKGSNDEPASGIGAIGHPKWSNMGRRALSPVDRGENVVENMELSSQLDVSSHVSGQVPPQMLLLFFITLESRVE